MYEHHKHPLLTPAQFRSRLVRHLLAAFAVLGGSLLIGTLGYRFAAGLPWIDAVMNAAMILSGMGPVDLLPSAGAKLFASAYAIFSGVVFLAVAGIVLAPVAHRMLHRLHIDDDE